MTPQRPMDVANDTDRRQVATPVSPPTSSHITKPQRVLACVLCQQRKVKCDRKFPCANCTKARVQCVPATLGPRRRRRKLHDRALLDRLKKYEDLLRTNNVAFEPLGTDDLLERPSHHEESGDDSENGHMDTAVPESSAVSTTSKSGGDYAAKSIWHAMTHEFREPGDESDSSRDDVRATVIRRAWDSSFDNDDFLLFGTRRITPNLSTFHPDPIQIFKLWQTFVDRVNPLLKVVHTPSLQARVIEAAGNLNNIDPNLEALMFSIYCMSILSLTEDECQTMCGSRKEDLSMKFRSGCQQALGNCGFLRTRDRECLTALFLYLVSIRSSTVTYSLSAMLGLAVRIAQRIGIHDESTLAKCTVFEAEMHRRLWWSLVLFDSRISETADHRVMTLNPTWDCRVPLNVNDSDLRPDMKELPQSQASYTDNTFAIIRAELGDYIRHTAYHLEFSSPALKPIAKQVEDAFVTDGTKPTKFEEAAQAKYFKRYDSEDPLQFMTMWTMRGHVAKYRLLEVHAKNLDSLTRRNEGLRETATSLALRMLECDEKIMSSPHAKQFIWFNHHYFPFIAYMQVAQTLKRQPLGAEAEDEWKMLSDHFEAWFASRFDITHPFFKIFANMILQAWEANESHLSNHPESMVEPPRIVSHMREILVHLKSSGEHINNEQTDINTSMDVGTIDELLMSMQTPTSLSDQNPQFAMAMPGDTGILHSPIYPGMHGLHPYHPHMLHRHGGALPGWPAWNPS